MKEIELSIKLRNNLLRERRLSAGIGAIQFAKMLGIQFGDYSALENMRVSPMRKQWWDGASRWRKIAVKIATYYSLEPEDLWPNALLAIKQPEVTTKLDAMEVATIAAVAMTTEPAELPSAVAEMHELQDATRRALKTLTPREEKVLRMRFGIGEESDHTLEEVGQDFEVTRGTIRKIEQRALRKLRHWSRIKQLKVFVNGDDGTEHQMVSASQETVQSDR